MMTDDEAFENLPDDPGMAFVKLEKHFKDKYEAATANSSESADYVFHQTTYLNEVIAAAKFLEIPGLCDYELPENEKNLWDFSRVVKRDVESIVVQIRLANSQSVNRYSVELNAAEKSKARHFLDQLDRLVDDSNFSQDKKEAIKKRLAELRAEIEQSRTRFDRVASKVMALARLSRDVESEGADPWFKWVKALFGVIDDAKENEPKRSIPAPRERKQIEAPRKQIPRFDSEGSSQDEVLF